MSRPFISCDTKAVKARPLAAARRGLAAGFAFAAMVATAGQVYAQELIKPEGIWHTKNDESIIRIHPCATPGGAPAPAGAPARFCGTVVWLKEPTNANGTPKADDQNPDPAKKGKPIVGLVVLLNLVADEDHWSGKAYNPDDGKQYEITFKVKTVKDPNDQADLRGCVLKVLCQTETFHRALEVPGGDPTLTAAATGKPAKAAHPGTGKHDASVK